MPTAAAYNHIRTNPRQLQKSAYGHPQVDGNVVRKPEVANRTQPRLRSSRELLQRSKALRAQRAKFIAVGSIAAVIIISLCVILLRSLALYNTLTDEVDAIEITYNNMILNNDAREYEISSAVDLNYVIDAATNELGMVRSNASQIVYYSTKNSEYLQQVARVPAP